MGLVPRAWVCSKCGCRSDAAVAPDGWGRCERCAESSIVEKARVSREDSRKGAVARLRAYYSAARGLVDARDSRALDATDSGEPHHVHRDWILGSRSDSDRDDSGVEAGISELMILWLEDLAADLESASTGASGTSRAAVGRRPDGRLESAARGLREATRDFAQAFRTEPAKAASCP
jgi:hypothetical protein